MIGEIRGDGQFNVVWKTKGTIRAQPWSPYVPGNENKPDRVSSVLPLDFGTETATAYSLNR
jgi:urea transport system substrate-binding protein